jgi:hypothetical protein
VDTKRTFSRTAQIRPAAQRRRTAADTSTPYLFVAEPKPDHGVSTPIGTRVASINGSDLTCTAARVSQAGERESDDTENLHGPIRRERRSRSTPPSAQRTEITWTDQTDPAHHEEHSPQRGPVSTGATRRRPSLDGPQLRRARMAWLGLLAVAGIVLCIKMWPSSAPTALTADMQLPHAAETSAACPRTHAPRNQAPTALAQALHAAIRTSRPTRRSPPVTLVPVACAGYKSTSCSPTTPDQTSSTAAPMTTSTSWLTRWAYPGGSTSITIRDAATAPAGHFPLLAVIRALADRGHMPLTTVGANCRSVRR